MKVIVVGTNNCWGRADLLSVAFKNAYKPKYFTAFLCSDETTVCEITGSLQYPLSGAEPVLIDSRLPKVAKKKEKAA